MKSKNHFHCRRGKISPEYSSWKCMRQRCLNKNHISYRHYGERGITICEQWSSFAIFLKDMGPRTPNHTLHRLDNSKGYSPSNCVWADIATQNKGKTISPLRSTRKYRGVNQLPSGRFSVRIKNCYMGSFDTAEDAARHFNELAQRLYGERACLNIV